MPERTCATCGISYTPVRKDQKYCTKPCAKRAHRYSRTATCSEPGCDRAVLARKLCSRHYHKANPSQAEPEATACTICGKPITRHMVGDRRPICSYRCRYALYYGRDIAQGKELVGPVPRRREAPVKPWSNGRPRFTSCACQWCGAGFVMDMKVTGVVPNYCTKRCSKAAGKHRYRQQRGQFTISKRDRLAIYERDGWTCQLCMQPVDKDLPTSDAWAATLDHIECQSWTAVPNHAATNLRLAHRMCNSLRGDTPGG